MRRCVCCRNLANEEALAHWGVVAPKTNKSGVNYTFNASTGSKLRYLQFDVRVFRVVMPFRLVNSYWRFAGSWYLRLQGQAAQNLIFGIQSLTRCGIDFLLFLE